MFNIHSPAWKVHCHNNRSSTDLARFFRECSGDGATHSMAVTATLLTLGQLGGPAMLRKPPGFVLINAGGAVGDPIDALTGKLTGLQGVQMDRDIESFERNRQSMLSELTFRSNALNASERISPEVAQQQAGAFRQYRHEAFGYGRMGSYTRRHDPELGWMTDASLHLPLRLEDDMDRAAFRADVRCEAARLCNPEGYGESITLERKVLSVAGSLRVDDWDEEFVAGVIKMALPVLFLPHTAECPLTVANVAALELMAIAMVQETTVTSHRPVEVVETTLLDDWSSPCIARLRRRLSKFPLDYEFFIHATIRQFCEWSHRIACMASMDGVGKQERISLWHELKAMSLHGISMGVDALGWHGYGFDAGCSRQQAVKILHAIREEGHITRRDLLRNQQWLDAAKRDLILERLAHEGLLTLSDRHVSAVTAADYFRTIETRSGISAPQIISPAPPVGKSSKSLAAGYAEIRAATDRVREQAMMPPGNHTGFAMANDGINYQL